jgi:hypothetical protein
MRKASTAKSAKEDAKLAKRNAWFCSTLQPFLAWLALASFAVKALLAAVAFL